MYVGTSVGKYILTYEFMVDVKVKPLSTVEYTSSPNKNPGFTLGIVCGLQSYNCHRTAWAATVVVTSFDRWRDAVCAAAAAAASTPRPTWEMNWTWWWCGGRSVSCMHCMAPIAGHAGHLKLRWRGTQRGLQASHGHWLSFTPITCTTGLTIRYTASRIHEEPCTDLLRGRWKCGSGKCMSDNVWKAVGKKCRLCFMMTASQSGEKELQRLFAWSIVIAAWLGL